MEQESKQEDESQKPKKKPATLQRYALIFFAAALFFVIFAALVQQRNINSVENMLDETKDTLISKTSMLQNVQEKLKESTEQQAVLANENKALQEKLIEKTIAMEKKLSVAANENFNMENLLKALKSYSDKDYKTAKVQMALIVNSAESFTEEVMEIYSELETKLNKIK